MPLVPIEEILDKTDSKFRLVIIAAKRSKQVNRGAPSLIQTRSVKPTYIALEEVAAGCVDYSVVPLEEAMAAGMLAEQGGRPTWFRDLTPEPVAVEEEEAAPEAEEPAPVVVAEEPAPVVAEGELVGLESLEGREEEEA
ncbi:MAG: DNA-directed RNA polymerase subunit omega [candidate division NC10 bacterium]|jgi:DNA-directed RNA polymerase subunit omega